MKKLTNQQWSDVGYRINSHKCSVCGDSGKYTDPNYGEIGSVDVLTVSCCNCGHVVVYDVAELARIADKFDKKCRAEGTR